MKNRNGELHKLERALAEAYRAGTEPPAGEVDVTQRVMRTIRQSTNEHDRWIPSGALDQFVLRVATIAAAVALVASLFTVGIFRAPVAESTGLLAEEFESTPLYGDY